ncbi:hypothetical protein AYI69_g7976, partial [Smittium culicis]
MVEVESYPALIEAIPSMDENFFRSPLEDDVRKDVRKDISYGCPKFIPMNYQPPPLNDTAPPNAKKTDSTLYSIQQSLAQVTRPLDHYIHEQLRQRRQIEPENNQDIVLVETMKNMLADLASTITQSRIDNLHKTIMLPGRTPQLIESKIKPLIANDQLETMIAAKKTVRKSRKKRKGPFRQSQQPGNIYSPAAAPVQQAAPAQTQSNTSHNKGDQSQGKRNQNFPQKGKNTNAQGRARGRGPPNYTPPPSLQKENDPGGERSHKERSSISLVKESHRESEGQEPGILQQFVYDSKEDGRPPPSLGSPEPQQSCGGTLIQDGNIEVHMQDDQEQGLHGVPGLGRRLHACVPIPSPPVWTLSEPSYLYQGTQTSPNLDQNSGNTSIGILGPPFDNRGVQGEVYGKHSNIVFPAYQTGIQNQFEEVEPDSFPINNSLGDGDQFQNDEPEGPQGQDQRSPSRSQQAAEDGENDFEMSSELYRKSSSHVGISSPRTPYVEKAIGAEEQRAEEFEFMDISGNAEQTRVTEPEILVPTTQEMERAIISAG